MEDYTLTDERKKKIDKLTRYEMCRIWRFAESGDWRIMGDCGLYFKKRLFEELGGFSPEISKQLSG